LPIPNVPPPLLTRYCPVKEDDDPFKDMFKEVVSSEAVVRVETLTIKSVYVCGILLNVYEATPPAGTV
jgi:hypothetical protein